MTGTPRQPREKAAGEPAGCDLREGWADHKDGAREPALKFVPD